MKTRILCVAVALLSIITFASPPRAAADTASSFSLSSSSVAVGSTIWLQFNSGLCHDDPYYYSSAGYQYVNFSQSSEAISMGGHSADLHADQCTTAPISIHGNTGYQYPATVTITATELDGTETSVTVTVTSPASSYSAPDFGALCRASPSCSASASLQARNRSSQQSKSTQSSTQDTPAAPDTPTISAFSVNGQPKDIAKTLTVTAGKPAVISGTTVPNGVIKLFIYSQPKQASVTADASGAWHYSLPHLAAGPHHIEAEVYNPATKLTSTRAAIVKFRVRIVSNTAQTAEDGSNLLVRGVPMLGLLLIIACIFRKQIRQRLLSRKKPATKKSKRSKKPRRRSRK